VINNWWTRKICRRSNLRKSRAGRTHFANWLLFALFLFGTLVAIPANALTQQQVFDLGIPYYNVDTGACDSTGIPLTDDQKIAATFMVGFDGGGTTGVKDMVAKYKIGGTYTTGSTTADTSGWNKAFYDELKTAAGHDMIFSNDNEGGQIRRESFVFTDSLQGMSDADITAKVGDMAKQMVSNGENTNLAPVLDLKGVGASDRNLSTNPTTVSAKAKLYADALTQNGIKPVFKHFPGFDSTATGNTDTQATTLSTSKADLIANNIKPYQDILGGNKYPGAMLILSNLYTQLDPDNMASNSKVTVDYVRNDLSFDGIIMTDSLTGPSKYAGDLPTLVANALAAGVTMPMFEYAGVDMDAIIAKVKANSTAMANIDAALTKIYGTNVISTTSATQSAGSLSAAAPTSLTGSNPEEKVWNYFIARGLTPVAAAGAMGNMAQEDASFDPYVGESGDTSWSQSVANVGFGLIQWTNTGGAGANGRRGKLIQYLENNGVTKPDRSPAGIDKALLLELNWLWDGEYGKNTWQDPVMAETTVDGDSTKQSPLVTADQKGNGSAMVFHAAVERSADGSKGLQERIDSAKDYLAKFGRLVGVSNCNGTVNLGGNGDIAKTAGLLAWPLLDNGKPSVNTNDGKPANTAYKTAITELSANNNAGNISGCNNPSGGGEGRVCALFVSVVMRYSGVDKDYSKNGVCTVNNNKYYMDSHPEKYQKVTIDSTADLRPGDIIVWLDKDHGHIYIYIGNGNTADASYSTSKPGTGGRTGSVRAGVWGISSSGASSGQTIYRFIGDATQ